MDSSARRRTRVQWCLSYQMGIRSYSMDDSLRKVR